MTEITDNIGGQRVRPLHLLFALILGPVAVTALTFWLYIPIFALLLGAPFYLIAGFPAAWFVFRNRALTTLGLVGLALVVNVLVAAALALWGAATGDADMLGRSAIHASYGSVFAAIWAAVSGLIYRNLLRLF